jgi:hypothetical protein
VGKPLTKSHGTMAAARRHYRAGEKPLKDYCMACYFAVQDDWHARARRDTRGEKDCPPVRSLLAEEIVLLHKLFPEYSGRALAGQLGVSPRHVSRVLARQGQV